MYLRCFCAFLLGGGLLGAAPPGDPDPKTLDRKVLLGYQGWFNCAGDGAPENNWRSWARGAPAAESLTIDMYPDLSELDKRELCAVPGMTIARQACIPVFSLERNDRDPSFSLDEGVRPRWSVGAAVRHEHRA